MSNLIRADQLFTSWKRDLLSGKAPVRWALADEDSPLNAIKAEPGSVTGLGDRARWRAGIGQNCGDDATDDRRAAVVRRSAGSGGEC